MKSAGLWLAASALAALGLACAEPEPPKPTGARLSARTADLALLLERLARLEGTPLGRAAGDLAARLPDCSVVEAHAPDADPHALLRALRCAAPETSSALAERDLSFVWPLEGAAPLRGELTIDDAANVEIELALPRDATRGVAALALPGTTPPGPGVLSATDALLHARVRPAGGLDLARLVSASGQGSQLFRLKSALFAGTVLDGSWEGAVYLPNGGEAAPPTALAVGFTARGPAVAAMEQFLTELQQTWGVTRSDFALGSARGACLPGLRILPELAPCYVATERALVLGWNPGSIARALEAAGERLGPHAGLHVALERFGEADALLAAAEQLAVPPPSTPLPWRRLRAEGHSGEEAVHLRLALEAEPST